MAKKKKKKEMGGRRPPRGKVSERAGPALPAAIEAAQRRAACRRGLAAAVDSGPLRALVGCSLSSTGPRAQRRPLGRAQQPKGSPLPASRRPGVTRPDVQAAVQRAAYQGTHLLRRLRPSQTVDRRHACRRGARGCPLGGARRAAGPPACCSGVGGRALDVPRQ